MCRHVLENQHKLQKFLQQHIRLCSSKTARVTIEKTDDDYIPKSTVQIQPSTTSILTQRVSHEPENGNLFSVCMFVIYNYYFKYFFILFLNIYIYFEQNIS